MKPHKMEEICLARDYDDFTGEHDLYITSALGLYHDKSDENIYKSPDGLYVGGFDLSKSSVNLFYVNGLNRNHTKGTDIKLDKPISKEEAFKQLVEMFTNDKQAYEGSVTLYRNGHHLG